VDLIPQRHYSRGRRRPLAPLGFSLLIGLAGVFAFAPTASAEIGDVVHEIDRCGHGWFGGVAWTEGYVYESCKSGDGTCAEIFKKHPVTGKVEQTLRVAVARPTYTNGVAYDSRRKCLWLAVGGDGIYQVDIATGKTLSYFDPFHHPYGLYYDHATDRLWISDNVYSQIRIYDLDDYDQKATIQLDFLPTGIERVGDYLWIAEPGGGAPPRPAVIHQCALNGTKTGVSIQLPFDHTYSMDVGDIAFDGRYLWAKGGKNTSLYQIDIGYDPAPSPSPVPTPLAAVLERTDYDGDGTSDPAIFRPAEGLWVVREVTRVGFGAIGDIPVPGDYDGDRTAEIAVFRPGPGSWAVRGFTRIVLGSSGDVPLAADLDGDGRCDPGVFRPGLGGWSIRGMTRFLFGSPGDAPLIGDFDGDGGNEYGVFRSSLGLWAIRDLTRFFFGQSGDVPVPDNYLSSAEDIVAVFRPSTGLWASVSGHRVYLGSGGDQVCPADYRGNAAALPAIFRSSSGEWSVYRLTRFLFGKAGDQSVTK